MTDAMSRTALVTGASQGIGTATAKALAAHGYRVIVHYDSQRNNALWINGAVVPVDGGAML